MARILVTGMSGAGKSTLLEELAQRGHLTVDTDYDGWQLPGTVWDEARMRELLARHDDVVVSGTVENQGRFYDQFEHVVLLSAPGEVLLERVATRTNNPYGRSADQQAEILEYLAQVEPLAAPRRDRRARRTPHHARSRCAGLIAQSRRPVSSAWRARMPRISNPRP